MTDFPRIIGLTGRATAGKNSVGDVLVNEYGYVQVAFADALKSMALVLDPIVYRTSGLDDVRLSGLVATVGWEEAKKVPEVRRFLQVLGTEAVRDHLGQNAWVDALHRNLWSRPGWSLMHFVITDVRFPNEEEFVHNQGGQVWRVERDVPKLDHPSESFVDDMDVDYIVHNDGPLDMLPSVVGALFAFQFGEYEAGDDYTYDQAEGREADRW